MVLNEQASARCRRIFQAFRNHEGWTDATFSHRLGGEIPPSTLSRLLTTGQNLSTGHVFPLARLLSERLPCDFALLWAHLVGGEGQPTIEPPPAVIDLEAAAVYSLKEAAFKPLLELLADVEATPTSSRLFTRLIPSHLLTLAVMKKLYRVLAEDFGGDVEGRYELMLAIGLKRRNKFIKSDRGSMSGQQVLLPESVALKLVRLEPPFHTCTRDEVDELIEGLIFDALRDRGVSVAWIGTLPGSIGAAVDGYFSRFDSVMAFENGPVIKRPTGKACVYHCGDDGTNGTTHRVLERDQAMLRVACLAPSYKLDDPRAVEGGLRRLLSIDSWADRSKHALHFRIPRAG